MALPQDMNRMDPFLKSASPYVYAAKPIRAASQFNCIHDSYVIQNRKTYLLLVHDNRISLWEWQPEGGFQFWAMQPVFGQIMCSHLIQPDHPTSQSQSHYPVLVISSDSGNLTYLQIDVTSSHRPISCLFRLAISDPGLEITTQGHVMAVDPTGHFLATGALNGSVIVRYGNMHFLRIATNMDSDSTDIMGNNHFDMMEVVQSLDTTTCEHKEIGLLWKMIFIYGQDRNPSTSHLVLGLNRGADFYIVYLRCTLRDNQLTIEAHVPHFIGNGVVPIHLAPLPNIPNVFVLISKDCIYTYRIDDRASVSLPTTLPLPGPFHSADIPESLNHLVSHIYPLQNSLLQDRQDIYMVSEAGHIMIASIHRQTRKIEVSHIGNKQQSICHFTILNDLPFTSTHSMTAFGACCDGQIYSVEPLLATLTSYGDRFGFDSAIVDVSPCIDAVANDTYGEGFDCLYVTSGMAPFSSVREIRGGIHVKVNGTSDADSMTGVTGIWTIDRSSGSSSTTEFVVLSFVNATRCMRLMDNELDDVTENSGLDPNVCTIFCSAVPDHPSFLVQVCSTGVLLLRPPSSHHNRNESDEDDDMIPSYLWRMPRDGLIGYATIISEFLVLSSPSSQSLVILKLLIDEDTAAMAALQVYETKLDSEITCLSCKPSSKSDSHSDLILAGTRSPSFIIYRVTADGSLQKLAETSLVAFGEPGMSIPQSIGLLNQNTWVVGLRNGSVLSFGVHWGEGTGIPHLSLLSSENLGTFPVQIIFNPSCDSRMGDPYVLALTDRPWKLVIDHCQKLHVEPISFDTIRNAAPFHLNLETRSSPSLSHHNLDGFLFVQDSGIQAVDLASRRQNNIRKFPLSGTARRIVMDQASGYLIVATWTKNLKTNPSRVYAIDPKSGEAMACEELSQEEAIHSITVWPIKAGKRYICVGTYGYKPASSATTTSTPQATAKSGRLLVYSLHEKSKSTSDRRSGGSSSSSYPMRFKRVGEKTFSGTVKTLCSFKNSYLLVGCELDMFLVAVGLKSRQIETRATKRFRYPIQKIRTQGPHILVCTERDSITLYDWDSDKAEFRFIKADRYSRATTDFLSVDDSFVIGCDRYGSIFGLEVNAKSPEASFSTAFSYSVGEPVNRVLCGSLLRQMRPDPTSPWVSWSDQKLSLNTSAKSTKLVKSFHCVYASGISGTIYGFLRLNPSAYHTLHALQTILSSQSITQPLLGHSIVKFHSKETPLQNAIDGEYVSCFLELSQDVQEDVLAQARQFLTDPQQTSGRDVNAISMDSRSLSVEDVCEMIVTLNGMAG